MSNLYTPKRICDTLGISQSALRIYCDKYANHLTKEAITPPRKFWEDDLKMLAFVISKTKEGRTHEQVLDLLEKDEGKVELQEFKEEWEATEQPTDPTGGESTALVPVAALQAAQALMLDAKRREEEAREQAIARERELLDQVHRLQREMGKAEGKIESLEAQLHQPLPRRKPPAWWVRLFGGE